MRFEAGSQLIAHFDQDVDADALRETTERLLLDALTSMSGVRIEVAKGCTIVYITFIIFKEASQAGVMKLLNELSIKGATVTLCPGLDKQFGVLKLHAEGPHCVPSLY